MLQNPVFRVQARFAKVLDDLILRWAYNWLRGEGGYFVEREGRRSRLPPAMRFVEVADFALEFMARLEELRENKDNYFGELIQLAKAILLTHEVSVVHIITLMAYFREKLKKKSVLRSLLSRSHFFCCYAPAFCCCCY